MYPWIKNDLKIIVKSFENCSIGLQSWSFDLSIHRSKFMSFNFSFKFWCRWYNFWHNNTWPKGVFPYIPSNHFPTLVGKMMALGKWVLGKSCSTVDANIEKLQHLKKHCNRVFYSSERTGKVVVGKMTQGKWLWEKRHITMDQCILNSSN